MSFAQIGLIHALSKGVAQSELLTIILRPEKVNEVLELLDELGVDWMCLSQVEGVGRQRGHTEIFRGREYSIEPKPKVCLEILVEGGHQRDQIIRKVTEVVRTGYVGDGKVFVMRVEVPVNAADSTLASAAG